MKLSDTRIAALFLMSLSILAFEIEIMRVFAVTSWSNFGAMVISIALLGFGLAGTLLTLIVSRVRANPDAWMFTSAFALGPSIAASHTLAQQVPFNPVLIASDPAQLWWIAAYYALYGLPFFFAGLFIGTAFTIFASRLHSLYFWNMLGSGLGGLLILGFLFLFPPGFLIFPVVGISVLPALLCSVRWRPAENRYSARFLETFAVILCAGASVFLLARFGGTHVSDFKSESYARRYPDASLVHHSFSPLGDVNVFASSYFHFAPGLSDNAAVSLPRMPQNAFLGMFVDGNGPVGIMRKLGPGEEGYIDFLPMSAPYQVLRKPRVLVLKLGGGAGVHTALHHDARSVSVVESNGDLLRMLRDNAFFRTYTGGFLEDRRVKVVETEVRAFAGSTAERFDLVEIGLIDSIGLSQAGGYSVDENYTYTVEAIRDYLRCLAPSGILSITVWDRLSPPRNVPKLLATVVQSLGEAGVQDPARSMFVFNLLLSTATVLVKNGPFTAAEIASLNRFCSRMSFDVDYHAGIPGAAAGMADLLQGYQAAYSSTDSQGSAAGASGPDLKPSDLYRGVVQWMLEGRQDALYAGYVFDIRPATDDRPYYSGYLKPSTIPGLLSRAGEFPEEWGYLLLLGTLVQSMLFGFLVIMLPIAARSRGLGTGRRGLDRVIVYFGCLGLGYMLAEIYLIQRFVYYLADPVYANTIVITVLLVASGFGSLLGSRLRLHPRAAVLIAVAGIAASCAFLLFGLSPLLRSTLGLPLPLRALGATLIIAPFGLFLGVPFPTGISTLAEGDGTVVPWAWGVNGALSVTGAVLARVISTSAGFSGVVAGVAFLYIVAGAVFLRGLRAQVNTPEPLKAAGHSS